MVAQFYYTTWSVSGLVLLISTMFSYNGNNGYKDMKNFKISFSKRRWRSNMEKVLAIPNVTSTLIN
jgi:hypothetical protein